MAEHLKSRANLRSRLIPDKADLDAEMRDSALDHRSERCRPRLGATPAQEAAMLSVLIGVLIICVVGAICFWAIDKFVNEGRLATFSNCSWC